MSKKKIVCVIPARLASTRFPRKILAKIGDKTILQLVWESAVQSEKFDDVIIALDSEETRDHVDTFGGKHVMTSISHPTGTNRLIECMQKGAATADVWVNWQADEPFIPHAMIDDLLQGINGEGDVWTLRKEIRREDALSSHIPKVVTNKHHKALYFSRSIIPFDREGVTETLYKHIGLYAYTTKALHEIAEMPVSYLAGVEMLEQLTFLENGLTMYAYPTHYESHGIDTPEDYLKATLCYAG